MYCNKCGQMVSDISMICDKCGCIFLGEDITSKKKTASYNPVKDLQHKLKEIDDRKKEPKKKKKVNEFTPAIEAIKKELSDFGFFRDDDFESQKLADKKHLIQNFTIPESPKDMEKLAKYIDSVIESKKQHPDELTPIWKDKLTQLYNYAKANQNNSETFSKVERYYKNIKRRERHSKQRERLLLLSPLFIFTLLPALNFSIVNESPILLFLTILATGWIGILFLLVYDLLNKMIDSLKERGTKLKNPPKILRVIAWHLLIPAFSGLIVSLVFGYLALSVVLGLLLFSLFIFFVASYDC